MFKRRAKYRLTREEKKAIAIADTYSGANGYFKKSMELLIPFSANCLEGAVKITLDNVITDILNVENKSNTRYTQAVYTNEIIIECIRHLCEITNMFVKEVHKKGVLKSKDDFKNLTEADKAYIRDVENRIVHTCNVAHNRFYLLFKEYQRTQVV